MSKPKLSIVLPTFNESGNVFPMVAAIQKALDPQKIAYEIIYVDDSTDDTPDKVRAIAATHEHVHLIHRQAKDRTGLATAFLTGLAHAQASNVCCMDADLQHPPTLLPTMFAQLQTGTTSMVVASRFIEGGGDRGSHELHRQVFTKLLSFFVWLVLPATRATTDPMTGFFMFKKENVVMQGKGFRPLGFKILVELLVRAPSLVVAEVPLQFQERYSGTTKASAKQAFALIRHVFRLALTVPRQAKPLWIATGGAVVLTPLFTLLALAYTDLPLDAAITVGAGVGLSTFVAPVVATIATAVRGYIRPLSVPLVMHALRRTYKTVLTMIGVSVLGYILVLLYGLSAGTLSDTVLTIALFQLAQGIFAFFILSYAWEDPERIHMNSSPKTYAEPQYSFTALLPCVQEADVIGHTMTSIANIDYPNHLKELLVVLRDDDPETIVAAKKTLATLTDKNVRIVLISGEPRNKPHHLNAGLKEAANDLVCIFDAEDEPHREIYNVVNTTYVTKKCDVLQSGVQLMNFESNWYSLFNCLEYFLWFRSALHYFAHQGLIPLGGNTVFFKQAWLKRVGGWDQNCLTEDADIGIRLSIAGAKTAVIYDPMHATREETPPTLRSFIQQRTRWNQGFLQIIRKHRWGFGSALPFKKQALALFVLGWPILYSFLLIIIPFVAVSAFFLDVHPVVGLVTNLPTLLLIAFVTLQVISMHNFARIYNLRITVSRTLMALVWYIPYLLVLEYSAFRAVIRQLRAKTDWEKTEHINAHRMIPQDVVPNNVS